MLKRSLIFAELMVLGLLVLSIIGSRHVNAEEHSGLRGDPALEFVGPDGKAHGWILVNARKEPVIWATTQYIYIFGPLERFGNLLVPNWATTSNGLVRCEMVSLTGSNARPDLELFAPPAG